MIITMAGSRWTGSWKDQGTPYFKKPNALALKSTRAFRTGVVELIYRRP